MANDRSPFIIPIENVRLVKVDKNGFGMSYPRSDHRKHGLRLRKAIGLAGESESLRKDFQFMPSLFFQVETPQKTILKNYKTSLENLGFSIVRYSNVKKNVATVRIEKGAFAELDQRIVEYIESPDHVGKSYFSPVENLTAIPVEEKIKLDLENTTDKIPVIFDLYSSIPIKEKAAISQVVKSEISKYTSEIQQVDLQSGVTSFACSLSGAEISKVAEDFASIKDVQLNDTAFVVNSTALRDLPSELVIGDPLSKSEICVVDSGISDGSGVFKKIKTRTIKHLPTGSIDAHYVHGTFVASRCAFGDNIDSCLDTKSLQPYCRIIDAQTFGVNAKGEVIKPSLLHLIWAIESIVKALHNEVRVYNLSLNLKTAIKNNEFSKLGRHLDFLSREYKVLFVVAAGNIDNQLGKYPRNHFADPSARIASPADSILSITVGSISKYDNTNSLSLKDELSPFSRIGPGADKGVKPELVAHGGNLVRPYKSIPQLSTHGVSHDAKTLATNIGTSFSAPIISQNAQRLFDAYPGCHPNLVKALLFHFAQGMKIPTGVTNKEIHCTGFGEPRVDGAINAEAHNAVYICSGELDQENYQFVTFHIPKTLDYKNKKTKLKVRITVIYDPKVAEDNPMEYSQVRVALTLQKLARTGRKFVTFKSSSSYSIPWSPIIKFEKTFTRSFLTGAWDVRLRMFTRGDISPTYKQDYALIVEIIDEKKATDVYEDIREEYGNVYKNIQEAA